MRSYDSATLAAIAAGDVKARQMVWIEAKNRSTGATETLGIWNGDQAQDITVEGQARTYIAGGALLGVGIIDMRVGLNVIKRTFTLSPINDAVEQAIRGYDPRLAPIQVHRCLFDLTTDRITSVERIFEGTVDEAPITRPPAGGSAKVDLCCVSSARAGTRYAAGTKSFENLGALYRYSDVSGVVESG